VRKAWTQDEYDIAAYWFARGCTTGKPLAAKLSECGFPRSEYMAKSFIQRNRETLEQCTIDSTALKTLATLPVPAPGPAKVARSGPDLNWINSLLSLPDAEILKACDVTPTRLAIQALKGSTSLWKDLNTTLKGCESTFLPYSKKNTLNESEWKSFEQQILRFTSDVHTALSSLASKSGKARKTTKSQTTVTAPGIVAIKKQLAILAEARRTIKHGLEHTVPLVTAKLRENLKSLKCGKDLDLLQKHPCRGQWMRTYAALGTMRRKLRKSKQRLGRSLTRLDTKEERRRNTFLWHHKRAILYRNMIDSDMPTPTQDIFDKATEYYREENKSRNQDDFDVYSIPDIVRQVLPFKSPVHDPSQWHIEEEDIVRYLGTANQNAAAGWDGLPLRVWAKLNSTHPAMKAIYDVCRLNSRIPTFWQIATSILIPKKPVLKEGKDLRPIMLQCSLYKVYSGILGSKIHDFAKTHGIWSDEQRGFTNVNGTLLNLFLLQFAKDSFKRNKRKDSTLNTLFVDVQNAFGAVEYKQLIAIMFGLGFPRSLCEILWSILKGGAMIFSFEGKEVDILQKRGVKQGDPMSPIIFNLMTEPLWRIWRTHNIGYALNRKMNSLKIRPLGFADDVAILESDRGKMELATELLVSYFAWLSLKLVPSKCGLLKLQHDHTGTLVQDDWTVTIDGRPVQIIADKRIAPLPDADAAVVPTEIRYLGNWHNPHIRCYEGMKQLVERSRTKLDKLTAVQLPARYKIIAINQWIVDATIFSLATERVNTRHLDAIQGDVWKAFRSWFKLPPTSSLEVFTLPWNRHGMNLHDVRTIFAATIVRKYNYLMHGQMDTSAKTLVQASLKDSARARKFSGNFVGQKDVPSDRVNSFWSFAHRMALKYQTTNSRGEIELTEKNVTTKEHAITLEHLSTLGEQSEIHRAWINVNCQNAPIRKKWSPPDHYLKFWVKAFLQLLPTNAHRARHTPSINPYCKVCSPPLKETQHHILNGCPHRAANMLARHNKVQDLINSFLPVIPTDTKFIDKHIPSYHYKGQVKHDKPDILTLSHVRKKISILEFAVPYDRIIQEATREKAEKYAPLQKALKKKYPDYEITIVPIIIGSLGGMSPDLSKNLIKAGVPKDRLSTCLTKVHDTAITGSQWLWNRRYKYDPPQEL